MLTLPKIPNFENLNWKLESHDENEDPTYDRWYLYDGEEQLDLVGEVYFPFGENYTGWKWHCKTSGWKECNVADVEQAKLRCATSHIKFQMMNYAVARGNAFEQESRNNAVILEDDVSRYQQVYNIATRINNQKSDTKDVWDFSGTASDVLNMLAELQQALKLADHYSKLAHEKNEAIQTLVNDKALLEAKLELYDAELHDLKNLHDTVNDVHSILTNLTSENIKQIGKQYREEGLEAVKASINMKAKKLLESIDSLVTLDVNGVLVTSLDPTARNLLTQSHVMISALIL